MPTKHVPHSNQQGFTLAEVIMVIVLLGILSVVAVVKWPSDLKDEAALFEFKRALRYSQHKAMTRHFVAAGEAWGLEVAANKYYLGQYDGNCSTDCSDPRCAEEEYCDRSLLNNTNITLTGGPVWFNGLGEPIDAATGTLLGDTIFTINTGGADQTITVIAETGYVE